MHSVRAHVASLRRAVAVSAVESGCDPRTTPNGVVFTGEDREVILLALRAIYDQAPRRFADKDLENSWVYSQVVAHAHADLLNCDQFAIEVAAAAPLALLCFDHSRRSRLQEVLADDEIVGAAVAKDGRFLKFAAPAVRDSYPVVMAAVKNDGAALQFASERLRDSRPVVWEAVAHSRGVPLTPWEAIHLSSSTHENGRVIDHASERLRLDPEISLRAARALACVQPFWLTVSELEDEQVLLVAVRNGLRPPEWAMRDPDVVWEVLMRHGLYDDPLSRLLVHKYADLLAGNKQLVVTAMEQDLWPLAQKSDFFAQAAIWKQCADDPDVRRAALRGDPIWNSVLFLPEHFDDRDFVLDLLRRARTVASPMKRKQRAEAIAGRLTSLRLWHDRDVAIALVRCSPQSLDVLTHFASDRDVVREAVLQDDTMIRKAHADLLADEDFLVGLAGEVPLIVRRFPPIFAAKACSVAAAKFYKMFHVRSLVLPHFACDVDVLIEASRHNPESAMLDVEDAYGRSKWADPDFVERFFRGNGARSLPPCKWVYAPPAVGTACIERLVRVAMELPRSVRQADRLVRKAANDLLWAYAEWAYCWEPTPERELPPIVVAGLLCLDSEGSAPVGAAFARTIAQTCHALGRLDRDDADDALATLAVEFGEDHPPSSLLAERVVAARHRPCDADGEFSRAHKRARKLYEAGADAC